MTDDERTIDALRKAAASIKAGDWTAADRHLAVAVALVKLWAAEAKYGPREKR